MGSIAGNREILDVVVGSDPSSLRAHKRPTAATETGVCHVDYPNQLNGQRQARPRGSYSALPKHRELSMLAHGRWRLPVHAPIGRHHRRRAGPPASARAESDRGAYLCPSATVQICNPRMSRAAHSDVASALRRSSLEPASAQRLAGFLVGSTRCYPTIESDRCPSVSAPRCSHQPTPRGRHSP